MSNVQPINKLSEIPVAPHLPVMDSRNWMPREEVRRMTQESKGIFIPYPLLSVLVTLILVVVGGVVGLFVQVSTLNSTMMMRDMDHAKEVKQLSDTLGLLTLKVDDLREKQARMEGPRTPNKKGNN